jgi:hypothetical protein
MKEMDTSLAALSSKIDRNETYLHQFVWRKRPVQLKDKDRVALAELLQVTAEDLDVRREQPGNQEQLQLSTPTPDHSKLFDNEFREATPVMVPHYTDVDDIEPSSGSKWANLPASLSVSGAFILSITQPRQRLRADRVLVRTGQTPRVG